MPSFCTTSSGQIDSSHCPWTVSTSHARMSPWPAYATADGSLAAFTPEQSTSPRQDSNVDRNQGQDAASASAARIEHSSVNRCEVKKLVNHRYGVLAGHSCPVQDGLGVG